MVHTSDVKILIETDRLILRQLMVEDAAFILELVNSEGWLEFIGDRNIRTEYAAIKYIEDGPMKSYAQHGFGLSMVALKDSKIPIGICGVLKRESLQHPDIGFAFLPQFGGKGYAFESARATIDHARDVLQIKTILAITMPSNKKSIRLLERIGLSFVKMIPSEGENELMLFGNNPAI